MKELKQFAGYYKPHLKLFFADMAAALVLALCDLLFPLLTRKMLNDCIRAGTPEALRLLLLLGALLLGIYLLKYALNYFVTYYGHLTGVRMQADMRRDLFDHLERLPVSYFDSHKTGAIMSRMISDLFDISELAHHGPEDLFLSVLELLGAFIILLHINWMLALIIFAFLPLLILFVAHKRIKMRDASAQSKAETGEINASLENSVSGIRVSKAFTARNSENEHFGDGNRRFVHVRGIYYKAMAVFSAGSTFITDFLLLAMYIAGGLFCFYKKMDVVDFTTFVLYISVFTSPIKKLISFVEQYQNGMTGFHRFREIMDVEAEKDDPGATDAGTLRGDIAFENVTFQYDDGTKVLEDFSFRMKAGSTLALVGPSGGGKTTVCHLLPRFYEIEKGRITIDGRDIREMTRDSLRRNIGIVAQDVFLFNTSIGENIAYGVPGATKEQIERAARLANIHEFIEGLPAGYDTVVGERGIKLSGGQKQRVAIARAFLKDPPILILDEATSALDNATEILIQRSLDALSSGRTVIVVAHRLSTVKNADEILVITDDGVAERGKHGSLIRQGGIYASLWNSAVKSAAEDGQSEKSPQKNSREIVTKND